MTNWWKLGRLKENFGPLKEGDLVYYREIAIRRSLAVGICWWICPKEREPHFYSAAESYGGKGLNNLVKVLRNQLGSERKISKEANDLLNVELRKFLSSVHPEARPSATPLLRPSKLYPLKEIP